MKRSFLLPLLLVCACNPQPSTKPGGLVNEEQTRKVLEHHWVAFQANDLEATMADYTEESILVTPDKTYHGLTEIRANFVAAFGAFPKGTASLKLNKSIVTKDIGYILWEAVAPTFNLTFATDTFIIQDGKIVRQTYAGVAAAK
ncbi:MAG TPA: nuclear transport factor 2 family protein [Chryseolinea sp.]|nr:nuclear transport factor 2 family protein [Chryseolinea sp.]